MWKTLKTMLDYLKECLGEIESELWDWDCFFLLILRAKMWQSEKKNCTLALLSNFQSPQRKRKNWAHQFRTLPKTTIYFTLVSIERISCANLDIQSCSIQMWDTTCWPPARCGCFLWGVRRSNRWYLLSISTKPSPLNLTITFQSHQKQFSNWKLWYEHRTAADAGFAARIGWRSRFQVFSPAFGLCTFYVSEIISLWLERQIIIALLCIPALAISGTPYRLCENWGSLG